MRVRRPPSSTLRPTGRLALAGCRAYVRGARAYSRTFSASGVTAALIEARNSSDQGDHLTYAAEVKLESVLPWNRTLPVAGGRRGTSRIEPRFGRVAGALAGKPIEVRCWSEQDWRVIEEQQHRYSGHTGEIAGFVSAFQGSRANLAPVVCGRLVELTYTRAPDWTTYDHAFAVGALAHETEHLVAPASEAETECYAMQDVRRAARELGASRADADELAELYWREVYRDHPPGYVSDECRDGGVLDRSPEGGVWP